MKIRKAVALTTAVGIALAGLSLSAPANADPVADGYTIVGSDTLQDAVNALVNGTSITGSFVRFSGGGVNVGSFDATGSAVVQVRSNGPFLARPVGSGDGVKSLSRAQNLPSNSNTWTKNGLSANVLDQIDLARSSSGAATAAGNGDVSASGALLFVPFGRDAVSYAVKFGSGVSTADQALISSLSTAQLQQLYAGTTTAVGSTTIVPTLPQTSSGTRKFWLKVLTGSETGAAAGVATLNYNNTTLVENDGTQIPAAAAGQAVIIPFSAASWVAQANGATPSNSTTGVVLGSANGIAPVTGTAPLVPNASFYSTAYGRDVYIVAAAAKVIPGVDASKFDQALSDFIDPTLGTSITYFPTTGNSPVTARAVKLRFGFLPPASSATFRTNLFS